MSDARSDWDLVAQIKAGNELAFAELMARYKRPVLNFVFRLIGDATEAEDVAQDVFVRVYRGVQQPRFRDDGHKLSTWLFQIARNASVDRLRYRRRRPVAAPVADDRQHEPVAPGPTAAGELSAREIGAQIAAAVAQLPEAQRVAIVLAEYEGLSHADIAAVLKCSEKSVESRLYRARQWLRDRLAHLLA